MGKLYKEMGFEDAEKYLRTDLVRVESKDGVSGEITFMEAACLAQFKQLVIPRSTVMLELEMPSIERLYSSGNHFVES